MDRVLRWVPFVIVLAVGVYANRFDVVGLIADALLFGALWATFQLARGRYY